MSNGRLMAVITASILFFPGVGANAAFTLKELQGIERLIAGQNCTALMQHLQSNPAMLQGNDPLALELRNFTNGISTGLVNCLSTRGGSAGAVTEVVAAY